MNTASLLLIFASVTHKFDLPAGVLEAICYVESGYDYTQINYNDGGSNSVGVCQIKLETAHWLGFKGTEKDLLKPHNNIFYAGKYLHHLLVRYNYDRYKAVSAYNAGSYKIGKGGKAKNHRYTKKVYAVLKEDYQYAVLE